ncbi:MAG: hypothetical protein LBT60_00535, partial [Oscillospiraceae bacterium]|nr:hypothetical protein [Oscillospiraceae bacterium]
AIALWNGVFSAGGAALWLTTSLLGFFAGWSGAMGFQIRPHIVPAGLGLLGAWILAVGGELLVTALGFSEPAQIGSTLAMAAVAAFLLWRASGRITVRC